MLQKYLPYIAILISFGIFTFFCTTQLPSSFDGSEPSDFPNYYFAAKRWQENRPVYTDLYQEVHSKLGWLEYKAYPADTPATILLLSPLSLLDFQTASLLLVIFSITAFISIMYYFSRQQNIPVLNAITITCLALASQPFLFLIKRCHMEVLILALGILGLVLISKSFKILGGILWGIAASLKLFPLLWLIPGLFNKNQRESCYAGLVTFFLLSIVSGLALGTQNSLSFIFETIPRSSEWYGTIGNLSSVSFFTALLQSSYGTLVGFFFNIIIFIFLLRNIKTFSNQIEKSFVITTCAALFISPLSWINYFILTFPVLILLSKTTDFSQRSQAWLFCFACISFWNWPTAVETPWLSLTVLITFVPTITIFLLLISELFSQKHFETLD